jgi:hypothetical protein
MQQRVLILDMTRGEDCASIQALREVSTMFQRLQCTLSLCPLLLCAGTASAQWFEHRTPNLPRTPDGKPNLTAPRPTTPDGKPDVTGLWRLEPDRRTTVVPKDGVLAIEIERGSTITALPTSPTKFLAQGVALEFVAPDAKGIVNEFVVTIVEGEFKATRVK